MVCIKKTDGPTCFHPESDRLSPKRPLKLGNCPGLGHQHTGHLCIPQRQAAFQSHQDVQQLLLPHSLRQRRDEAKRQEDVKFSWPGGGSSCCARKNQSGQWVVNRSTSALRKQVQTSTSTHPVCSCPWTSGAPRPNITGSLPVSTLRTTGFCSACSYNSNSLYHFPLAGTV